MIAWIPNLAPDPFYGPFTFRLIDTLPKAKLHELRRLRTRVDANRLAKGLSSRHLLVVERLIGSIARNGRITHPW